MKKKLMSMLLVLLVLVMPFVCLTNVDAKTTKKKTTTTTVSTTKRSGPINMYIFYGSTCAYCAALHEWTATLVKDEDVNYMFNIVDYEVWNDDTNEQLMLDVADKLGTEIKGVPFIVIGDQYFAGYSEGSQDSILAAIKKAYEDKNYVDVVAGIGTGNVEDNSELTEDSDKERNNIIAYVILAITVVVILIILFGRSKTNKFYEVVTNEDTIEEEDEEEEEVISEEVEESKEEIKEEPKKEVKKAKKVKVEEKKVDEEKKTTKDKTTNKSTSTKKTKSSKNSSSKKNGKK